MNIHTIYSLAPLTTHDRGMFTLKANFKYSSLPSRVLIFERSDHPLVRHNKNQRTCATICLEEGSLLPVL